MKPRRIRSRGIRVVDLIVLECAADSSDLKNEAGDGWLADARHGAGRVDRAAFEEASEYGHALFGGDASHAIDVAT